MAESLPEGRTFQIAAPQFADAATARQEMLSHAEPLRSAEARSTEMLAWAARNMVATGDFAPSDPPALRRMEEIAARRPVRILRHAIDDYRRRAEGL